MWLAFGDQATAFVYQIPLTAGLRRRHFIRRARLLNLGQVVLIQGPVNLPESRKFPTATRPGSNSSPILVVRMRRPLAGRDLAHLLVSDCFNLQALPSLIIDMNASSFDEAL
jgi:hypothetical protein